MKKLFTLLVCIAAMATFAQAPQGFNYQATVRNSAGALITNQIVGFKFSIKQTSASGTTVYSETQYVTPDNLGQVSLVVGTGTPSTGTFATINWASGTYYLAIELNTGAGFVAMGTTQLLSVPYALYANSSGSTGDLQSQISTLQSQIDVLKKPQITTAPIGDLTSFSAVSGGAIISTGSGDISARGVVWGTSTNPTIALSTKTSDGSGLGSFTRVITGLSPNIKYYLRAYATNSNGTSYGEEVSFTPQAEVKYLNEPNVFVDTFRIGLQFRFLNNSNISAFQVDKQVTYNNSDASMRIDVPNADDPAGSYAGGAIYTELGRDLSGYNALTFWAKSTVAATIGSVGFGTDLETNTYPVSIENLKLSTAWRKIIIPIPDPSKLKNEKGLFYFSAGPKDGDGYSFWIDELKFENIANISIQQAAINDGRATTETKYLGETINVGNLTSTFNLPNGIIQSVRTSPNYFIFSSSNVKVATVNTLGVVTIVGPGSAIISATLGGLATKGSITIQSLGAFDHAPTPSKAAGNVISLFSDFYPSIKVDFFNGYWQPYQTTISADFSLQGDKVLNYTNFNFVGIQFATPTIDTATMTHLHMDIFIPESVTSGSNLKIEINDFGADGVYAGTDNTSQTYTKYDLVSNSWNTIDIPLTLADRAHLAQLIFMGTNISSFYADNIYFYKN